MNCGQPLVQATGSAAALPLKSNNTKILVAVIVLLALIAGFLALSASGLLQAWGRSPGTATLKAEGAVSTTPLRIEGTQNTAPLNVTGDRKVMPPDIRAWLEHLERVEKKRSSLCMDQLSESIVAMTELQLGGSLDALQGLIDDPEGDFKNTPTQKTHDSYESHTKDWQALVDEFHSLPPPGECVPIAKEYDVALGETKNMILEMIKAIEDSENDRSGAIKTLSQMRGTSSDRVGKPSTRTDILVGDICRKYDTSKWFSISSDYGGGMFGKIGL